MKSGSMIEFNRNVKIVTIFFVFYLAVVAFTVYYLGPLFTVTTPLHPIAGAIAIFVEAAVGLKATKLFGGRRNFTGRLLTYYSIALIAEGVSWVIWGLFAGGQIPSGVTLVVLTLGTFLGQFIASFTLVVSARALFVKLDRRSIMLILVSQGDPSQSQVLLGFQSSWKNSLR